MEEHNLTIEIGFELALMPADQWEQSLAGIQARVQRIEGLSGSEKVLAIMGENERRYREQDEAMFGVNRFPRIAPPMLLPGLNNQSVHDKETEEGIHSSIQKLHQRYLTKQMHSLPDVITILHNKADALQ